MITAPELFSMLSDETRLRCLILLHSEKKLCVCELCAVLESIQPKISRHLALLRKSGLVSDERKGQWIYYSLNPALQKWIHDIIAAHFDSLKNMEPYSSDIKKAHSLRNKKICD